MAGAVTVRHEEKNGHGPRLPRGMRRVRWVHGHEPEMQCGVCYEFLPLNEKMWIPEHGMGRCRACYVEANAERLRRYRSDPGYRSFEARASKDRREYARDYYRRKYSTLARFQRERGVIAA